MKNLMLLSVILGSCVMLYGQDEQLVSTGIGYSLQSYVQLEEGTQKQVSNSAWDIAFSVREGEAGVFINESVGSSTGAQPIEVFYTLTTDFSVTPDTSTYLQFPLWNLEQSWSYGAVNEIRNPEDEDDFGWGDYNQSTGDIEGGHVYVIELRDDSPIKFQVQSLSGGVYTFRYANLDGTGEVNRMINKADHDGKLLAYFSFDTGDVVDVEPEGGFDFIFERYVAQLHDPQGGDPIPYLVTGVLSGPDVLVAEARGIDPADAVYEDFVDSLSGNLEVIGHDWKFFDLGGFQWILEQNLVYFLKAGDGHVWKIRFIEFGGSGNGNATFEKTDLGVISSVKDARPGDEMILYPNPAQDVVTLLIDRQAERPDYGTVSLLDSYGRMVLSNEVSVLNGFSAIDIDISDIPPGLYTFILEVNDQSVFSRLVIAK